MFTLYQPLIIVVLFAWLFTILQCSVSSCHPSMNIMGYFLCLLSMFKFFNLQNFVDGFSMYDIVAQRFRVYGYAYPFIELCLGILCITHWLPFLTNVLMLVVMSVSTVGVINGMRSDQKIQCACMGTALDIPLTTVSLLENISMGLIALWNLF